MVLWLNYCGAAVVSFFLIYILKWPWARGIIAAVAISVSIFLFFIVGLNGRFDDPWFGFALFVNASFAFMFAGAAAWLGQYLLLHRD